MNVKNVLSSKPKDVSSKPKNVSLTERYSKIGIAAVEAAARYQRKGDKAKSTKAGGDTKQKSQVWRGTSPKR